MIPIQFQHAVVLVLHFLHHRWEWQKYTAVHAVENITLLSKLSRNKKIKKWKICKKQDGKILKTIKIDCCAAKKIRLTEAKSDGNCSRNIVLSLKNFAIYFKGLYDS